MSRTSSSSLTASTIVLLLACAGLAGARAQRPAPTPVASIDTTLTVEQARTDFDQLRAALEEAHGGLHRHIPKPTLDRAFDSLRARLTGPVSRRALAAVLAEMIARIGDGHAHLEFDRPTVDALRRAPIFPLRLAVEDSALVVVHNYSATDSSVRPGMEVVAIEGSGAREVVRRMLQVLPGDGFIESGKRASIVRSFAESYWLYVDPRESFTISVRDSSGATITSHLAGVPSAERVPERNAVNASMLAGEAALWRPSDVVAVRFIGDGSVAQLRIRWFDGEDFPRRLDDAMQTVRERGARTLVLDLRGNPGGVDEYGALLVSQLVTTPFRYFDRIHLASTRPSFNTWRAGTSERLAAGVAPDPSGGWLVKPALHGGVGVQQPARAAFGGRVIVLMDGGTFSTAADVCAVLRHLGRATFIGEETGGGYEGNTSGLNALVSLAHSRLALKVPMYGYWNAVRAPRERGRGTIPDRAVLARTRDVMRGLDAVLEVALGVAAER
ncbi:MAG TPA: S41 family peptidase [Gemmatimonadaceae bacterium]|nr:S41 family peptidase [Gemmatimonadaceae bacterium]